MRMDSKVKINMDMNMNLTKMANKLLKQGENEIMIKIKIKNEYMETI